MRIAYKIWLENQGNAFGEGHFQLLGMVEETGSLSRAAKALNMSYQKAWVSIRKSEERLGFKLLERKVGGVAGGGSRLTAEARGLLRSYTRLREEAERELTALFEKHFGRPDSGSG